MLDSGHSPFAFIQRIRCWKEVIKYLNPLLITQCSKSFGRCKLNASNFIIGMKCSTLNCNGFFLNLTQRWILTFMQIAINFNWNWYSFPNSFDIWQMQMAFSWVPLEASDGVTHKQAQWKMRLLRLKHVIVHREQRNVSLLFSGHTKWLSMGK